MLMDEEMNIQKEFALGEGLVGQCALEKERILLTNVPEELYKDRFGSWESISR